METAADIAWDREFKRICSEWPHKTSGTAYLDGDFDMLPPLSYDGPLFEDSPLNLDECEKDNARKRRFSDIMEELDTTMTPGIFVGPEPAQEVPAEIEPLDLSEQEIQALLTEFINGFTAEPVDAEPSTPAEEEIQGELILLQDDDTILVPELLPEFMADLEQIEFPVLRTGLDEGSAVPITFTDPFNFEETI